GDPLAYANADGGAAVNEDIHARAEFDHAHTLAARHEVADFLVKDNSPRQQAGDLLKDDHLPAALHGDDILLVAAGALGSHGVPEQTFAIAPAANDAGNRRAVHVDVKDAEKDTDARARPAIEIHRDNIRDAPIGGRDYRPFQCGNGALGIAKEPEKEGGQQQG